MVKPIRLYMDEDTLAEALVRALRTRNVDLITTAEAEQMKAGDEDQIAYAATVDRTLFTYNTKHFVPLHRAYILSGRHHSGIIVSPQLSVGEALRRLLRLMDSLSPEDMQDRLEFLSNWR